jgi:A/G-specific adenine glycosylase
MTRFFALEAPLPAAKPQLRKLAQTLLPDVRCGDFAQAIMDLGATICTPRRPACALCPWTTRCRAYSRDDQESFPRKAPKRHGHLRRGAAFVVRRADGAILLRTRAANGLLGGMAEVPTTQWKADFDDRNVLVQAPRIDGTAVTWSRLPGVIAHTFTHFPLQLTVYAAAVDARAAAPDGTRWVAISALSGEALPSVMRKVLAHALHSRKVAKHAGAALNDERSKQRGG